MAAGKVPQRKGNKSSGPERMGKRGKTVPAAGRSTGAIRHRDASVSSGCSRAGRKHPEPQLMLVLVHVVTFKMVQNGILKVRA